jgi:hypothetical protein
MRTAIHKQPITVEPAPPPAFCIFLSNLSLIYEGAIGQSEKTTFGLEPLPETDKDFFSYVRPRVKDSCNAITQRKRQLLANTKRGKGAKNYDEFVHIILGNGIVL